MYWFGKKLQSGEHVWESTESWAELKSLRVEFARTKTSQIIEVLDSFSKLWFVDSPLFKEALPLLDSSSGFSPEEVRKTLSILPKLLSKEALEKRLRGEFFPIEILDGFSKTPHFAGKVRAMPLGTLLHVTAGNVFLSSIDSLLMGLLTKNLNIIKTSGQNTFFPLYFAEKLSLHDSHNVIANKFSILYWKGGDVEIETLFKSKVDGIVAWGGEEMMESYSKGLPPHVKFLGFGPKISVQILTCEGLKGKDFLEVAKKIVDDIIPWDQSACASPQNLYLQEGIAVDELLKALDQSFKTAPPRGKLEADEAVEILKERYRGIYSELMEGGKVHSCETHLLHLERSKYLRPSPLNRSLIIKRFKDEEDLLRHLEPFSYYMQSCGYLLGDGEKGTYLECLSLCGIKRFAPLGTMTWGMEGAPHDGRNVLRELTHMVGDELRSIDYGGSSEVFTGSGEVKKHFERGEHPPGYIFTSGGTTGEPKYIHFSYEEFDHITDMLAHNLRCQGITRGMKVANLFVAGNLWSSFMAMDKALEKVGAIQLPIGGLCSQENIVQYLQKFRPDMVMGIPSLLVMSADFAAAKGVGLEIPMVFYAGEPLSQARKDYLSRSWKTTYFGSAGYASVDAGMIAYQCDKCEPGEHHLFSDLVSLKIVDEEAVITSHYRTSLPIINYRTGDRVKWAESGRCGSVDKKFKLLGRVDSIIQIWSSRIRLEEIEKSIAEVSDVKTWQVSLREENKGDRFYEVLEVSLEGGEGMEEKLLERMHANSKDLRDSVSFEHFKQFTIIKILGAGEIPRNERTGKISLVKDHRR